jgi:hypothetical protein
MEEVEAGAVVMFKVSAVVLWHGILLLKTMPQPYCDTSRVFCLPAPLYQ